MSNPGRTAARTAPRRNIHGPMCASAPAYVPSRRKVLTPPRLPSFVSLSPDPGAGTGTPPPPPPAGWEPSEDSLRTIYRWSAQTRRSVAAWRREESRFLWPLLAFIVALFVGDELGAYVLFIVASSGALSAGITLLVLVTANGAIPVASAVILYVFFRSRNRRLDRQLERATEPPTLLPPNLIEGSLAELAETEGTLRSIHRRIWWIVFIACFLSLGVGEFAGSLTFQAYLDITGTTVYPLLDSFLFTYGVGLAIAGVLIAWNALYWRRVERRLAELGRETAARRTEIGLLEQALWQRL
jgi:hypothetical protein